MSERSSDGLVVLVVCTWNGESQIRRFESWHEAGEKKKKMQSDSCANQDLNLNLNLNRKRRDENKVNIIIVSFIYFRL